jgi:integrase
LPFTHATKPRQIRAVFSHHEASRIFRQLQGHAWFSVSLMYGSGLRASEACRLRIQDIELVHGFIIVREAKGE